MRFGILFAIGIGLMSSTAAFAQAPWAQQNGAPGIVVGGLLRSKGAVKVPDWRFARPMPPPMFPRYVAPQYPAYYPPMQAQPAPAQHQPQHQQPQSQPPRQSLIRRTVNLFTVGGAENADRLPMPPSEYAEPGVGDKSESKTPAIRPQPIAEPKVQQTPAAAPQCVECQYVPAPVVMDAVTCNPVNYGPTPVFSRPPHAPPSYRCYGGVEYLLWWIDEQDVPGLVNRGAGANLVTFGNGEVPGTQDYRHGGRITVGYWLNNEQSWGLEFSGFMLDSDRSDTTITPLANAPLTRPFFNVVTNAADAVPINQANITTSFEMWGAAVTCRSELYRTSGGHIDLIRGLRYLHLAEDINITDQRPLNGGIVTGSDVFDTENDYLGWFFGLEMESRVAWLHVNGWFKCSMGAMDRTVTISGANGILVRATNVGRDSDTSFAIVPEAGVKLGVQLSESFRFSGGYTVILLTDVVRPGDQIDNGINLMNVGGPARPSPLFNDTDFLLHGLTAEIEFRF